MATVSPVCIIEGDFSGNVNISDYILDIFLFYIAVIILQISIVQYNIRNFTLIMTLLNILIE